MGAIVSLSEFFAISGMLWKSTWRSAFRERLVSIFHVMFVDMHMQPIVTFLFWPITIVRTFTASRSNTSTSDLHEMSVGPLRSRKRVRAFYRSMRHYGAKHFFGFVVWGLIIVMVSYGMLIVEEAGSISKWTVPKTYCQNLRVKNGRFRRWQKHMSLSAHGQPRTNCLK